jgi:hypothetical protein
LANHGERQLKSIVGSADLGYEVEFRKAIANTIPSFIRRLEDEHWDVRLKTIEVIGELVDHGEL